MRTQPQTWDLGVDFGTDSQRVVAVHVCSDELKYVDWQGPVDRSAWPELERWARRRLDLMGGYVHLFPADGDGSEELHDYNEALDAEEEEE
jgi:hypothetical protein